MDRPLYRQQRRTIDERFKKNLDIDGLHISEETNMCKKTTGRRDQSKVILCTSLILHARPYISVESSYHWHRWHVGWSYADNWMHATRDSNQEYIWQEYVVLQISWILQRNPIVESWSIAPVERRNKRRKSSVPTTIWIVRNNCYNLNYIGFFCMKKTEIILTSLPLSFTLSLFV